MLAEGDEPGWYTAMDKLEQDNREREISKEKARALKFELRLTNHRRSVPNLFVENSDELDRLSQ